jgi:glycosyltransferase involved in cell wall biosynthesis
MGMIDQVLISIIVPVYNGHEVLPRCLEALRGSTYRSYELIVVDDNSTDDSAEIARKMGASVYHMAVQSGPAAARNLGAQKARGEILLFVDADVVVQPDSVSRVAIDLQEHSEAAAVFGSYDDAPAEENFLSQYKNLYHHFIHQRGLTEATTFWAGCGAIRKTVFDAGGGFNEKLYSRPCIEDIELGYRLRQMGYRILLDKKLQCKHLKKWQWKSLLRADIFYRAIPWSQLILQSEEMVNDLNLQTREKVSSGIVALLLCVFAFALFEPRALAVLPLLLIAIVALNHKMYAFFLKRKGLAFACRAFLMQLLHYFYSGIAFATCWGLHAVSTQVTSREASVSPKRSLP